MNLLGRNKSGEFCLVSISMRQDSYVVAVTYLHNDGNLRVRGGEWAEKSRDVAEFKARHVYSEKKKKKGYEEVSTDELPLAGWVHLAVDLDNYVSQDEMLEMIKNARLERYVEFSCVIGIEDRFDEDLEYLAIKDEEEDGFYYVYDRYGKKCHCHDSRFSRLELTERALEAHADDEYACPACEDSQYGCANCTS